MLKIDAEVPSDQYLAIAWGTGMSGVDVVNFKASGDGEVQDMWSGGYYKPSIDSSQDYVDTDITKSGNNYKFVTYRKLDTADSSDTEIKCGKEYTFSWVGHSGTASMRKHNKSGRFQFKIADDCSVSSEGKEFKPQDERYGDDGSGNYYYGGVEAYDGSTEYKKSGASRLMAMVSSIAIVAMNI